MTKSKMSAVVLAGGQSTRMGTDKAFLTYRGRFFVRIITDEMLGISDEVLLMIGKKDRKPFEDALDERVKIMGDEYDLGNPMGGMLSACERLTREYAAFVACDTPLLKGQIFTFLYERAVNHSAAIPIWENGDTEPLFGVYSVSETKEAGLTALKDGRVGPKSLTSYLRDVVYVSVSELRRFDPNLLSLMNVNSKKDLASLKGVK